MNRPSAPANSKPDTSRPGRAWWPRRLPGRLLASGLLAAVAMVAGIAAPALAATAAPGHSAAPNLPARAQAVTAGQAAQRAGSPAGSTPSDEVLFSLLPANATKPDGRLRFSYGNVTPGSVITDHVALINRGSEAAYTLYGTDATGTTLKNTLTFLQSGQQPKDIGSWVHFQPSGAATLHEVLAANQGLLLTFTIDVPGDATPGDHTGAVIAAFELPRLIRGGRAVYLYQRIAVPIELRVTGALNPGLRVESVSTSFNDPINPIGTGSATVSFSVVNTGNVRITGTDWLTVTGPFGKKVHLNLPKLPVILPGDSVRVSGTASGLYPLGPMTATATVVPAFPSLLLAAGEKLPPVSQDSASLFAVPWALIVVILVLAGLGFGIRYYLRWRTRQQHEIVAEAVARARTDTARSILGGSGGTGGGTGSAGDSA